MTVIVFLHRFCLLKPKRFLLCWADKSFLSVLRADFAQIQNEVLQKNGFSIRVDHRTLKAQKEAAEEMRKAQKEAAKLALESDFVKEYVPEGILQEYAGF